MSRVVLILVLLALLAGASSAQVFIYNFTNDPLGTTLNKIWKEDLGDWSVSSFNKQHWLRAQPTSSWQYCTAPTYSYLNCCVECEVAHPGSNLVFGGVALRCIGGGSNKDLIMAKMQGSGGLNGMWLYSYDAGTGRSVKSATYTSTQKGTIRLIAVNNQALAQVDANGDDRWDAQVVVNMSWTPKAGPIGFCGYNGAYMDKFRFWDGVIAGDQTSPTPTPGAVVNFRLYGAKGLPYQAASSLSRSGLLLPNATVLPLSADNLFTASATDVLPTIFRKYRGVMDSNGEATISLAIPNIAALKGVMVYTAFVNYRAPYTLNVSNDHRTLIQ